MKPPFLSDKPQWLALLWLISIVFCSLGISSFLSLVVVKVIYGIDVLDIQAFLGDYNNPFLLPALKVMQTFQAIGGFILPPMFFAQLYTGNALEIEGSFSRPKWMELAIGILLIVAAQPMINFTAEWNSSLNFPDIIGIEQWVKEQEESTARLTEKFLDMPSAGSMFFNLFMIGMLPAVGEEFLFRGTLQPIFRRMTGSVNFAVIFTAFLFSAMHLQFYGFIPRFLLGIVLGYFAVWSGSIWVSVLAHLFNNGAAVILAYLIQHNNINKSIESIGTGGDWKAALLSLALCLFLLQQFYLRRKKFME